MLQRLSIKPLVLFLSSLILLTSLPSYSGERFDFYDGIRGLGMGGAQIATVNDETSLLVNPAGLGKLRDYFITVADPEMTVGQNLQRVFNLDVLGFRNPQTMLDKIRSGSYQGKPVYEKFQLFPSAVFPNFGMGIYDSYRANGEVDTSDTNFTYQYRNDLALVFGFNFRLWDGRIKLGFNTKIINRTEIDRTDIPASSTDLTIKNLSKEGLGVASDVGLILTAPWKLLPTLAVVYRDVGTTHYNVQDGYFYSTTDRPDATPATLDAAFAIFPITGQGTRITFSAEYRDVLKAVTEAEEDSAKRIHAGLEFNIRDAFFIRAGWNQRYWTAGLEIAVANYQLQLASYGEEIGTASATREDRRYLVKFAYRF